MHQPLILQGRSFRPARAIRRAAVLTALALLTHPSARAQTAADASGGTNSSENVVKLSPFEVKAGAVGYFAPNTTSGTRFNTPIEDLAASLTVVTPAQMADFAMLDINDVFAYTASTEGTETYTDFTVDRNGSVQDNVSLDPTQANRIRAISSANISFDNFELMGRMPIDPTIIDGLEVSRGPNATIFGLGNPSGTVNQIAAQANLEHNHARVQARFDSFDGYRTSLDVNRVLLPNKLAVRVSGVFQRRGYVLKPSGTNTVRYNAMIKYRPFKGTTISAGAYYYRMNGNRPNAMPPRDNVSYWIASGEPTWDPVTETVHLNGATLGPYTNSSKLPDYFIDTLTGATHSQIFINGDGSVGYWSVPQVTNSTSPINTDPSSSKFLSTVTSGTSRFVAPNSAAGVQKGRVSDQPLFTTTPSISDKSIYDWSSINIASLNRIMDRELMTEVKLDQFFFDTPMQSLVGQVAFLREDAQRYKRNLVNTSNDNGQSGQLFIDVNERLLDGSPNPYFLRPYIGTDQPRTTWEPAKWDTYRGQLLYRLDLTGQNSWIKWLGRHELAGYDEYKYRINRRYSYRDAIANNLSWIPPNVPRGNQSKVSVNGGPSVAASQLTRNYYRYYVGGAGNVVQYAPANFSYGTYPFVWGGQGGVFHTDQADLQQVAVTDSTGAGSNNKTILKTLGAVLQDHFLNDAIVTTFGLREDKQYEKSGSTPVLLNPDGISFDYNSINHWAVGDYAFNSGKTKTGEVVFRPFKDSFRSRHGLWADALRGLAFTYDKSDSFIPQVPRVNLFQQELPNTKGKDEEYGLWWNITNKFVLRLNHYDTKVLSNRNGDASTVAGRVARFDVWDDKSYRLWDNVTAWVTDDPAHAGWTQQQINDEIGKELGLSNDLATTMYDEYAAGHLGSTQDAEGKGWELEVNYNPTDYWTVQASVTKGESINTNYSQDIAQWIAQRMPVWTTIMDPRGPDHVWGTPDDGPVLWWTSSFSGQSQTPQQNYEQFVATPFAVIQQLDGKSNPEVRKYNARVSTSVNLAGITSHPILRDVTLGGAVRWEDKGAIGYYGIADASGIYQSLDASRPIYDKAHTYFDLFVRYRIKLFAGRVPTTFQFNVKNLGDKIRLQAIGANPDGSINSYRIMDPAQYIFTVTFDL